MSPAAAGSLRGWGAGTRVAGAVFTLGYLLGIVRGPLIAVAGGLALVTLGRCAAARGSDDLVFGGALAVLAGALQVGGLRWATPDLAELRGAQAVLGPTLLVGPEATAAACWVATAAATAALAAWLAAARTADETVTGSRLPRILWFGDAGLGALAVVTVFWGFAIPRGSFGGGSAVLAVLEGVLAVAAVAGAAVGGATWLARAREWRSRILAVAGAAVVAAAAVVIPAVS
ncbi:MAG TPA: hypothetical protein VHF45_02155 [Thermoleophilaceae bacterium]|nr:hypothetical protein [Thermoleophilaceae bacterium]